MDPFAPTGPPKGQRAVRTPLEQFTFRMQHLGATPGEIAAVAENWDRFDDDWTPATREQVIGWTDEQIVESILDTRAEYEENQRGVPR